MGSFTKNLGLLLLGSWLGMSLFFAAGVAPVLFQSGQEGALGNMDRELAGAIVGVLLKEIYRATYVLVGAAFLSLAIAAFGEARGAKGPRRALMLTLLILGLNTVNHVWILNKIHHIKLEMMNSETQGEQILKKDFDRWHTFSTYVYGGALVLGCGAVLVLLPAVASGKGSGSSRAKGKK